MAKFRGLIKHCEVCGTEFKVPKSQAHVRTCSRECGYKIRKVANKVEWVKWECKHCRKPSFDPPSLAAQRIYCSKACSFLDPEAFAFRSQKISGDKNPSWKGGVTKRVISSSGIVYSREQPHKENERSVRRQRAKEMATPVWANSQTILKIYEQAQRISRLTGIKHHVDHVVPLTSKHVCGLHNEFNLRVIPGVENLKKHNRSWPEMWK